MNEISKLNKFMSLDPIDDLLRGFFVRPVDFKMPYKNNAADAPIQVSESPTEFTVHAELPGVKKEDIHVTFDTGLLNIAASRKEEKTEKSGKTIHSERFFGSISRSISLGEIADESRAKATFTDGVLELSIPKKSLAENKKTLQID